MKVGTVFIAKRKLKHPHVQFNFKKSNSKKNYATFSIIMVYAAISQLLICITGITHITKIKLPS